MKVGVGADHGGFEMKQELAKLLAGEGHDVVDFGNKTYKATTTIPISQFLSPARWQAAWSNAASWYAAAAWERLWPRTRFTARGQRYATTSSRRVKE
jgi:hypothetical protein